MTDKKPNEKLEREYTIPLRHRWQIVPRYQRANKAVKAVKEFLVRHMKVRDRDLNKIRLDKYLNEILWVRGIQNPPSRIKVKAIKEGDIVRVEPAELRDDIKFKKLREEKIEKSAKEKKSKRKIEEKQEVNEDKNNDGIEDKKEVEEKGGKQEVSHSSVEDDERKKSVIEAGKEMEKEIAKAEKHTTKVQSPKQEKNQRTGYNQSGRGH